MRLCGSSASRIGDHAIDFTSSKRVMARTGGMTSEALIPGRGMSRCGFARFASKELTFASFRLQT
jgi:hypothetical protein